MKIQVGVMGSASDLALSSQATRKQAVDLGRAIARRNVTLLTGATTGLIYEVGRAARDNGALHIGISPARNQQEHVEHYKLPVDACDLMIYTGFGLKGRNVVLVRSCDIAIFIAGGMGSLNEFTIAHDERKIVGCLAGSGGVADDADHLLNKFSPNPAFRVIREMDADGLLAKCLDAFNTLISRS